MGRPRKPTALKLLEGAQPCRINRSEPAPAKGLGPAPDTLDDDGLVAWNRIGRQLDAVGLLTVADAEVVSHYCSAWSVWIKASRAISEDGLTVSGQFGEKPNPNVAILNKTHDQMIRILSQLGMTPAARASLSVQKKDDEDPLLTYFAAKPDGKKAAK